MKQIIRHIFRTVLVTIIACVIFWVSIPIVLTLYMFALSTFKMIFGDTARTLISETMMGRLSAIAAFAMMLIPSAYFALKVGTKSKWPLST